MDVLVRGKVGYDMGESGSERPVRLTPEDALVVVETQGRYTERGRSHRAFTGVISGYTAIATTIPLAAAGTPMAALWNPPNSNIIIEVLREMFSCRSGTAGGSILRQVANTNQTAITAAATAANVRTTGIQDGGPKGPSGKFYSAVALTGSAALVNDVGLGAPGTAPSLPVDHETNGELLIFPGGLVAWVTTAAGTSYVLDGEIIWGEIPLISPE